MEQLPEAEEELLLTEAETLEADVELLQTVVEAEAEGLVS